MSEFKKIRLILDLIDDVNKKKLYLNCIGQVLISIFDLIGIALIGLIGALTVNGVSSQRPGDRSLVLLKFARLENLPFQKQIAILAVIATFMLVLKTILSVILQRRSLALISRISSKMSTQLFSRLLKLNQDLIQRYKNQEYLYAFTGGVNFLVLAVIGVGSTFLADLALLVILSALIFLVNPLLAFLTVSYFLLIGFLLYFILHKRAFRLGIEDAKFSNKAASRINEVLNSYREIHVRNRKQFYVDILDSIQIQRADIYAEKAFMPNISKYVIEIALIIGALSISAAQFLILDARHAIAVLALFLAAGSRIAPAVLRLQQGIIQFRSHIGSGDVTFRLISELLVVTNQEIQSSDETHTSDKFAPVLVIKDLEYEPLDKNFHLGPISLTVAGFTHVAIVGNSGSGKSTFADLLLGINSPIRGRIFISGKSPRDAVRIWPDKISYVPQVVSLIDGTIKENICLGFDPKTFSDSFVLEVIKKVSLFEFIETLPDGIHHYIGENGSKISGGQKQRIGLARALLTRPGLLVLDEATSALDSETESEIADLLHSFSMEMTVIIIAHRLRTLREAKRVLYFSNGKILGDGAFDELSKKFPSLSDENVLGS